MTRIVRLLFLTLAISWLIDMEDNNVMAEEPRLYFEQDVAHIAVRISIQNSNMQQTYGTGFFYRFDVTLSNGASVPMLLLISNKHVFGNPTSLMTLNINRKKNNGSPDLGNTESVEFSGFVDLYYPHPDLEVDLAAVDVTHLLHRKLGEASLYIMNVVEKFLTPINYEKVFPGSSVLFVGYPSGFYDTHNNLPLVRKGTLSSVPSVNFKGKAELVIDAEVFPGSSGSPVFIPWDGEYNLLGVLSQSVDAPEIIAGSKMIIQIQEHIGLGIVIKQSRVKELINHIKEIKEK